VISNRDVLIRVNSTSLEFPRICPVCGSAATKHRYISRTKKDGGNDAISANRKYNPWLPPLPSPTTRFSLDIPVCDKHYKSSTELRMGRSMTAIIAGFSAPLSIILGIVIAFSWYDRILLPIEFYVISSLSWFVLLWSLRGLGATDLDRSISIVDFARGNPIVIIRVKARWYVDEILAMNQSSKIIGRTRSFPL